MYQLSLVNHTGHSLVVDLRTDNLDTVIYPYSKGNFTSKKWKDLAAVKLSESLTNLEKEFPGTGCSTILKLRKSTPLSKYGWEIIKGTAALPFTAYRIVVTKRHHQLIIFPKRSLSSFLEDMPSSLPLSSLMLPGTHNSVAFFGWPISQCQVPSTPLITQFLSGIRVLDIRLSIINGVLLSYHGIFPQKLPFLDIVQAVHAFLASSEGKNETIVMSIKQEDQASLLFSQLVYEAVHDGPGGRNMWFLQNRIPTLGEVRGKVVLFSRFGGNGEGWEGGLEGLGIHPTTWPDSEKEGFEWWLKGTKVKTHDWYSINSFLVLPEKAARASRILVQPTSSPFPVQSITFLSASSFPLALPRTVACGFGWPAWGLGIEGVNGRVGKWILSLFSGDNIARQAKMSQEGYIIPLTTDARTVETRLRGWCMMDFFEEPVDVGLVRLLVECNYRGRKVGEEGWP